MAAIGAEAYVRVRPSRWLRHHPDDTAICPAG